MWLQETAASAGSRFTLHRILQESIKYRCSMYIPLTARVNYDKLQSNADFHRFRGALWHILLESLNASS